MTHDQIYSLAVQLNALGFGDIKPLVDLLNETIRPNLREFTLTREVRFEDRYTVQAIIYFRMTSAGDSFYICFYIATLRFPDQPEGERSQTFYLNRRDGITLKEAFNLLSGRAVYKELIEFDGNTYFAWLLLSFERKDSLGNHRVVLFRESYGYDLSQSLSRYPIEELQKEDSKMVLIHSLQKGDRPLVTFVKATKTQKMYIEANPRYKTINIYPLHCISPYKE